MEHPGVGGCRDWPLPMTLRLLGSPRVTLPDIGIAPRVLLQSALRLVPPARVTSDSSSSIPFDGWLSVRGAVRCS